MKKQLLSRTRLSQLLFSLGLFLLCLNVGWAQTTVYHETFGTAAVASGYTGGTSTVPAGVTYTVSQVSVNSSSGVMNSRTDVVGTAPDTNGFLFNNLSTSGNAKYYLSAPYSSSLASTLVANTGKITWTVNMRHNRTTVMGTNSKYDDGNTYGGIILCSTTSGPIYSSGNGYAVIMTRATGSTTQNAFRLIKMVGGFPSSATTTTHPTLIESLPFGATGTFVNYRSVKVTYDPGTATWELFTREDGATAFADPETGSYTSAGTSTNADYTGTAMATYGYFSANGGTSTGMQYDNFKIVRAGAATTPSITSGTAFTAFSYEGVGPSAVQSTVITGANLTNDITLNAALLTKYEVSLSNSPFTAETGTVNLGTTGGTIYVRLKSGLAAGAQNEDIVLQSSPATDLTIACSGSVIGSYTLNATGDLTALASWTPMPSAMNEVGAKFNVNRDAETNNAWVLGAGAKIIVGSSATLTIADTFPITVGTIDVGAGASLKIQADTYPTFGTLNTSSNVHLQKQPTTNSANTSFGNLIFDGDDITFFGHATILNSQFTINGTLTVNEGVQLNINNTGTSNAFYFVGSAKANIQGSTRTSRALNFVTFGTGATAYSSATGAAGFQFAAAEDPGVNFILGPNSLVEFNRGSTSTNQVITARSDYKNLKISDGSSTANIKNVAGTVNVSGTLTLNLSQSASSITNTGSGQFVLGNAASIVRTVGSFGVAVPIVFGTSVDVTYNGTTAITTGVEIPAATSVLNNLEIDNVGGVTIPTGNNVTVNNNIVNNGILTVENNANLVQTSVANGNSGTGTATVKRNGSALLRSDYTLWSSPVANQNLLAFSPATTSTRFYNYDTTFGSNGAYSVVADPATTPFAVGTGYLIRMPNTDPTSNYDAGTATLNYPGVFTGTLNNGPLSVALVDGLASGLRYNLVGNPYPSPITMTTFVADNTANIESTLYFWRKTNGVGTAYCSWAGGVFTTNSNAQSVDPAGIIQTGQGFFVEAKSGATSLAFNNAQRVVNNANQFFKTRQVADNSRIWLNATNAAGAFSQMAVNYTAEATNGLDAYDGKYINDSAFALTSNVNNGEYTIQGRPSFDATDVVALNFKAITAGEYTIAIDHADGVFANGQDVYLVDNTTGTVTDLNAGSYTFTAASGADNTRFSLTYQKTLSVNSAAFNDNSITVYKNNGTLYVKSGASAISSIKVFDIQGRLIAEQKSVNANVASINNLKATNQALIVQVTSDDNKVVSKKVVN